MAEERIAPTAAQLHDSHFDEVYRYVHRRIGRREDAEDVAIEVMEAAFEQLPRFRGESQPRLWLLGIARLKVARALRTRGRRPETTGVPPEEPGPPGDCPWREVVRTEARAELRRIIQGLPENQREVLLLKYVDGLSLAEIAIVMNRSCAAVSSLLQRARATAYRSGRPYFGQSVEDATYERA